MQYLLIKILYTSFIKANIEKLEENTLYFLQQKSHLLKGFCVRCNQSPIMGIARPLPLSFILSVYAVNIITSTLKKMGCYSLVQQSTLWQEIISILLPYNQQKA